MKKTEIKGLSESELKDTIKAERENLLKLKFAHSISPIENPMRIKASKKIIARLETELRAKALANKA